MNEKKKKWEKRREKKYNVKPQKMGMTLDIK